MVVDHHQTIVRMGRPSTINRGNQIIEILNPRVEEEAGEVEQAQGNGRSSFRAADKAGSCSRLITASQEPDRMCQDSQDSQDFSAHSVRCRRQGMPADHRALRGKWICVADL